MNCIITGASKGFGRAIAEKFAAAGYNLYLSSRNADVTQELSRQYPAVTVRSASFDLSVKEQSQAFGQWVLDQGVAIDVLVNNAGLFIPGSVHDEADGALEQMMAINLYSAYHLTRVLLPSMIARKSGHVFNMCSVASFKAYSNGGAYSIAKHALAGFSANLREEMKPHGIKVTTVYSGAAYTDSWKGSGVDPERIMEAADVADLIYGATQLSPRATVEEILVRPQLGDL